MANKYFIEKGEQSYICVHIEMFTVAPREGTRFDQGGGGGGGSKLTPDGDWNYTQ